MKITPVPLLRDLPANCLVSLCRRCEHYCMTGELCASDEEAQRCKTTLPAPKMEFGYRFLPMTLAHWNIPCP